MEWQPSTTEQIEAATVGGARRHDATIELQSYDPNWPHLFELEKERILSILCDRVLLLEHVGSTSVPGLAAKPIIDILLVVPDSSDEPAYLPDLVFGGYLLRVRESDWHQHRMLKGPDTNINLHVFSPDCVEIGRQLGFRNWLRSNLADRALYEQTKRQLAARHWEYMQNYADAKTQVVEEIITRAMATGALT